MQLLPLKQVNNKYILELNTSNYEEAMERLKDHDRILVTPYNTEYLIDTYSENDKRYQWLLNTAEAPEYPVMMTNHSLLFLTQCPILGRARQNTPGTFCDCDHCSDVLHWICEDCHQIFEIKKGQVKKPCACENTSFENIEFFCYSEWNNLHRDPQPNVPI